MNETKHSVKRSRERIGLNKKTVHKNAEKALNFGIGQADIKNGSLLKYLNYLYYKSHRKGAKIRIYNQFVYIFAKDTLITVFRLPQIYVQQADKIQRRKEQENMNSLAV